MKSATFGLCVLLVVCAGSTAKAQCGCGGSVPSYHAHPAPMAPSHYAPHSLPRPMSGISSSSVAYVNKLATPVPRSNYTLNYAVHLTDGRILLSDFLPPGQTVRGIESQTGSGGRRLNTNSSGGLISVIDPANNSTVATFAPPRY